MLHIQTKVLPFDSKVLKGRMGYKINKAFIL